MIKRNKRPGTHAGFVVFIVGAILSIIVEFMLINSFTEYKQYGFFTLMLVGFIIMIIGILLNRQFYVDNYNEMNPRDIIRNN